MKVKNKESFKQKVLTRTFIVRIFIVALSLAVLSAITMVLIELKSEAEDKTAVRPPGQLVTLNDEQKVHLNCKGSGSPVVILEAGMGGTSLDWKIIQQKISNTTKVCSYDRHGYAWSDEATSPRNVDNEEKELYELLQKASIKPPYIIAGHSFGGYIARLFATRHNNQVNGLVLIDPSQETDRNYDANPPAYTDPFVNLSLYLTLAKSYLGIVRSDYRTNYTNSDLRTKEQVAFLSSAKNFRTMQSEYSELSNSSRYILNNSKSVGNIPTVYIVTSHRIGQSEEFCKISKRCIVKDSGANDHLIPRSNPGIVIDAIETMLVKNEPVM